ncbi:MAG: glycoside hydrolase family 42 [Thermoproteus sp. AZ2]|uniref:Glycoside hydrolase family 42 n=1 Tax=Thermoproteus sp. AZ2 TaxID=1609232 RepID=A0ACC6V2C5_9CREN
MFLLGVNYWPRLHNIKMWKEWNEGDLAKDLDQMRELGIRAVRFFILAEDFFDPYGGVYEGSLAKLKRFMEMLGERGIRGFPTLIVGHMSGRNWKIPWAPDGDVYRPEAVERGVRAVSEVVKALRGHKALGGWILSNELSLVKRAESREEALALLRAYSSAIKSLDPHAPFTSGDVSSSYLQEPPNVKGLVDFVGVHLYPYDSNAVRHAYLYPAYIELFSLDGEVPVLLEEFGFSTYQFSEEAHALFINDVLWSALAHEALGAFIWCFSDFGQEADPPYDWRLLELGFGLVRADGSVKPAGEVVRAFAKDLERLEALGLGERYRRPRAEAAVVVPFYMYRDYEFVSQSLKAEVGIRPALQALSLAFMAGLRASAVYELDRERLRKKLLIFPSVATALATTWRAAYEGSGVVYASVFRAFGRAWALHDAATHLWRELFGVENATTPGSYGVEYSGIFRMKFVEDFGPIKAGEELELALDSPVYTYVVRPKDARVLAVDHRNRPVLLAAKRAVLSTIPIELLLSTMSHVDWLRGYHRIYAALAQMAGIEIPLYTPDPRIEVATFEGPEGRLVIAINHSYERLEAPLLGEKISSAEKIAGSGEVEPPVLRLGPKEAVAFLAK